MKGLTLIEVILVTALLLIISVSTIPVVGRNLTAANLESTVEMLISSIRKSQAYAVAKKDGQNWGVCFLNNTIRLFSGSCNSPLVQENYQIPSGVGVSGLTSLVFDKNGELSAEQNIVVSNGGETKMININLVGGVSVY